MDDRIKKMTYSKRENAWDGFIEKLKLRNIEPLFTKKIFVIREVEFYEYKCLECENTFQINNTASKIHLRRIKCCHCTAKNSPKRNVDQYNQSYICFICGKEMKGTSQLFVAHLKSHDIETKDYYDKYLKKEGEGTCQREGCDKSTKFNRLGNGYDKHCCQKCGAMDDNTREKYKKSMIENYGVDNGLKLDVCNELRSQPLTPETIKKMADTNMEKRGVKAPAQDPAVLKKMAATNMKRRGVKAPAQDPAVMDKIKNKHRDVTGGYDNVFASPEWKEKIKAHYRKKYGCDYAYQVPEFKDKIRETKRKEYWDIYYAKLKLKKIKPLFDKDFYITNDEFEFEFECLRCEKKFKRKETEAYSINCGCLVYSSKYEIEIKEIIEKYGITNIKKTKLFYIDKKRRELDIYLPDYNLGIEYCGLYHHSEAHKKRTNDYHQDKYFFFKELNISVIQIFESEWFHKQDIVISIIKNKLNLSDNKRIYARQCNIKAISNNIYQEFLISNHLQGAKVTSIKLGLFYHDELVAVMGLGKSKFNASYEYEIYRFCNKIGYNTIGGFSKMLKYFETTHIPKSLISYVDIKYFDGVSYMKNGFSLSHITNPGYCYFKNNGNSELYNRIKFQKHKLKDLLDDFDPNKTEHQNMLDNGYLRIYDAGNLVYTKNY